MIDFNENMKLVYYVYEKYFKRYSFLKDDLCQEGFLALFKACKLYQSKKGFTFATYSIRAIKNNMLDYLQKRQLKHLEKTKTFSQLEEENVNIDNYHYTIDNDFMFIDEFNDLIKDYTPNKKNIIIDCFLNEMTIKQVAEKYQISYSYISKVKRLFRKGFIKE